MSSVLDEKREQLFNAADLFVRGGKQVEEQQRLCEAASAYHYARMEHFKATHAPKSDTNGSKAKYVIPFGETKGTPIGEAETKDLEYVVKKLREGLDEPDRQKWRARNEELITAIEVELGTR